MNKKMAALLLALALILCSCPAALALGTAPAPMAAAALPSAPGTKKESNAKATIDYSNTADGYVMVQYTASTANRLKVQVKNANTYT